MFDLDDFKLQLAQTIAWCAPRVSIDDPKYSLRALLPAPVYELADADLLMRLFEPLSEIRATMLAAQYTIDSSKRRVMRQLPAGIREGQLMAFYPASLSGNPAPSVASQGFFDWNICPAWDTWVYHGKEKLLFTYGYDDLEYVICWIPPHIAKLVDRAIAVDKSGCIEWLSQTSIPFSFLKALAAEGLL